VDFEAKMVDLKVELDRETDSFDDLKRKQEDHDQKIEESNRLIEMIREELTTTSRKLDSKQTNTTSPNLWSKTWKVFRRPSNF